jgi:hypothetical protein
MNNGKLLRYIVILIILVSLAFPYTIFASTPEESVQHEQVPTVSILNTTSTTVELSVHFPDQPLIIGDKGKVFNESIYSHPSDVGVPDLPVIRTNIELPIADEYSVEVINSQSYMGTLGEDGLPKSIPDRQPEVEKCEAGQECDDPTQEETSQELTGTPTETLTEEPTEEPTQEPTETFTQTPTEEPTEESTETPTQTPTQTSTATLTVEPTEEPTETFTPTPTEELTATPTEEPTQEESFDSENAFPNSPVQMLNTYTLRGQSFTQFQFWPVQYNPADQTVQIYQSMTIRITFQEQTLRMSSTSSTAKSSDTFEDIYSDQTLNNESELQSDSTRDAKSGEVMLIIAPDAFLSTLSTLVNLKEEQGFSTTLVGLSTTGTTTTGIKNYIQNAYNTWSPAPTYVLLVGDVNNGSLSMPAFTGQSSGTVTDLYYGTVDGSDWIPDVFVGRLPARNTTQLNTMINNLIAYHNLTGAESWVKKASFLASSDSNYWDFAEATQNYVINTHTAPEGYTGTFPNSPQSGGDKLYAVTYSAGNSQVVNAINNKRALISYTGHGSRSSWGGPYYNQSNIRDISNSNVFSVVTSFACVTGDFSTTESFGETWLLQSGKGAVAFIGASSSSFWGPDDTLERAMMDALYSGADSANLVSSFRYAGLMAIEAERPGTGTAQSRYYWEIYNLLGDPSLEMLIEPKPIANYKPVLSSSSVSVSQAPGSVVTVTLQLTNAGALTDTYDVNLSPESGSASVRTSKSVELASGESTTIEVTFTIPEDAEFGQVEQYELIATSQNDKEAEDRSTIELKAAMLSFVPLLIQP